ncbi:hypothetical protein EON80_27175, partial [bacterium]
MKTLRPLLLLALMPMLSLSPAWSQPQGRPGGPGGPGGFGGMRNSPKGKISRFLRGLERIEESKTPLNKAQAKKIVSIVSPWRTRKAMTDDQAKTVYTSLTNVLTVAQKKEIESRRGPGGPGGPGGRDGGRPDGPPGGGRDGGGREGGREGGGRGPGGPGGGDFQRPTEAQMNAMRKSMAS